MFPTHTQCTQKDLQALDLGDPVGDGPEDDLPGLQVITGDTAGGQFVDEESAKVLKLLAEDSTRLVAEGHVADLTTQLERSGQVADHGVQTVSDELDLGLEGIVGRQSGLVDVSEGGKLGLEAGVGLQEPVHNKM